MEATIVFLITVAVVGFFLALDYVRTLIWRHRGTGPRRRRNSDE